MKKAALSLFAFVIVLFTFSAVDIAAQEIRVDAERFASIQGHTLQNSRDVFKNYFDADEFEMRLRDAVMNFEPSLDISEYKIPSTLLSEFYFFFSDTITDCFHVNLDSVWFVKNGNITTIDFAYLVEKDRYDEYLEKWNSKIDEFLFGIKDNDSLSDVQKALLIHDRIITHCEYDYENYKAHSVPDASYTPYGVVIEGVAVCQGYAELYSYLMTLVDIESYLCSSKLLDHVWNILFIDGEYYYVDVTWDDAVWDISGRVMHTNFLCSYEEFKKTHVADDYDTTPSSTKYDNYFWRDCRSSFELIGDEIYYVDFSEARIETYDGSAVWDVSTYWLTGDGSSYYPGCYTYITAYEDFLLFNMPDSIYAYDTMAKTAKKVLTPHDPFSTSENIYNIFGFREKNDKLLLEFNHKADFSEKTKQDYTIVTDIDPDWFKVSVEAVSLDKETETAAVGEMRTLVATVAPANATNKNVSWRSSDENVAVVKDGVVTAINAGTVTITVTTEDGSKTAKCVITVKAEADEKDALTFKVGEAKAIAGKQIKLAIDIENNPGISGVVLEIGYDRSVMSLVEYESASYIQATSNFDEDESHDKAIFSLTFSSNHVESGTILTLVFEIKADAPLGDYAVTISCPKVAANQALEILGCKLVSGEITVSDSICGDINRDGRIDIKDSVLLVQYLAKWNVEVDEAGADCDADGDIDIKDSVLLAQYLAEWNVHLG